MKYLLLLFALLLLPAPAQKKPKPPEIEIVSSRAARQDRVIAVDGRVKNVGEKSIRKIVVSFDFMGADDRVLTTKHAGIGQEELAPGEETDFSLQLEDTPKAAYFRVKMLEDGSGRELRFLEPAKQAIE